MPERVLIEGYKRVISEIYSPRKWFERNLKLLEHFPQDPPPRKAEIFREDAKLWHKIKYITKDLLFFLKQIFSFYGFEYIKFIMKAQKVNKANYLGGVIFASAFIHYYGIAQQIINKPYTYVCDSERPPSRPKTA